MSEKTKKEPVPRVSSYNLDQIFPDSTQNRVIQRDDALDDTMKRIEERRNKNLIKVSRDLEYTKTMNEINKELLEARKTEAEVRKAEEDAKKAAETPKPVEAANQAQVQTTSLTPQLIQVVAGIEDPETRQLMINLLLASIRSTSKNDNALTEVIALATMDKMRQHPETPQIDMVKMVQAMTDQIRVGVEIARQGQLPAQQQNPVDVVGLVKEIASVFKGSQPAGGQLEGLVKDDVIFSRLKDMGMFGGNKGQGDINSTFGLDAAKYKADVELRIEQMKQERELRERQAEFTAEAESQKWMVIEKMLSGPLGTVIQGIGGAAANRLQPGQQQQPPQMNVQNRGKPQTMEIACPQCNGRIITNVNAKRVICPYCNALLEAQSNEEIQNNQIRQQQQQQQSQQQSTDQQQSDQSEVPQ